MHTSEKLKKIVSDALKDTNIYELSADIIAKKCGIKKSSLFHHFKTMDELFKKSVIYGWNEWGKQLAFIRIIQIRGMLKYSSIYPETVKTIEDIYDKVVIDMPVDTAEDEF
jgi:Na+-transporting NADH:ubiquinone oxidoreductase subunit NqrE